VTIVTVPNFGPMSNVTIAPAMGGSLTSMLIQTGIEIGETIIRNYVNQQISAISQKIQNKVDPRKEGGQARRYSSSQYWKRKRPYKNDNYRKRRRSSY